jgi:hypothetical protein
MGETCNTHLRSTSPRTKTGLASGLFGEEFKYLYRALIQLNGIEGRLDDIRCSLNIIVN